MTAPINVTVTSLSESVQVTGASSESVSIANGGGVAVAIGTVAVGDSLVTAGTVQVGKVTTLSPGSSATVVNNGTAIAAVLDFGIPTGVTPAFAIGTVSTLAAGSVATVTATTKNSGANVTLDFGIPRGDPGEGGGSSVSLSDATPASLGTASPGTSSLASRADHVHAVPVISYASLTNVPSTFAPAAHQHAIADVTGLQTALDSKSATSHGHNYVTALNNLTGSLTLAAGTNVTITPSGSTLTIASTASGVGLSDATPEPLGLAQAGEDAEAARADHAHAMPTAADVGALDSDSLVDGGDYVGVVITPGPSITITAQPTAQSVTVGGVGEIQSNLPSGTWGATVRVNSQWMVSGYESSQADYIAVSSDGVGWTKRTGLPAAGQWSPIQYANSVYATQAQNRVAYSSDAITWGESAISFSRGSVFGAGGKFLRATQSHLYHSTDAATWTQGQAWSGSASLYFGHDGTTFFAAETLGGIRASADGETWGGLYSSGNYWAVPLGGRLGPISFQGATYIGRSTSTPIKYQSGTFSTVTGMGTYGGEFATDGTTLVYYRYAGSIGGVNQGAILTSTNGSTFTVRTLPDTLPTQKIATLIYTGSRFVLYRHPFQSENGTTYYTSVDGIEWTKGTRTHTSFNASNAFLSGATFASQSGGVWNSITFGGTTATATFSVGAYFDGGTPTYQWQISLDGGSTWNNVTDATASTLVLTGLTSADSGKRYRVQISATGAATVTSNSATLTVT